MVRFGPNKTTSHTCLRYGIGLLLLLAFVFVTIVVLFAAVPRLRRYHVLYHDRIDDGQEHGQIKSGGSISTPKGSRLARIVAEDEELVRNDLKVNSSNKLSNDKELANDEEFRKTEEFDGLVIEPRADVIEANYMVHKPFDAFTGTPVTVEVRQGQLSGLEGFVFGRKVRAFLGVPFAEPPIGKLRFRRPQPVTDWRPQVLMAHSPRPHCVQHFDPEMIRARHPTTYVLSEDCLYLNIWAPVSIDSDQSNQKLKPVMLWLFGGGYISGSNNLDETDGRVLASLGDVVVIAANYRNGALGFLDLGVDSCPGNQGLYDNVLAIKWVKDNVRTFGGDPDQLTLFGQSAGAISIGLMMINPSTSGLFSRAIMQSGSPVMLNFFFSRTEETASNFVASMGCEPSNSTVSEDELDDEYSVQDKSGILDCLMNKSTKEIIDGQQPLLKKAYPFTPSPFDNELLPYMASEAIKFGPGDDGYNRTFTNIHEVLLGSNRDEASVILFLEMPELFGADRIHLNISTADELRNLLISNFSHEFNIDSSKATLFANMFFSEGQEQDTTLNLVRRLYKVIGDLAFTCPVTTLASTLSDRGTKVFQYEFSQRAQSSPWGEWMGVPHGDEYLFAFGYPLRYPDRFSGDDIEVSKRMIKTWSHFARTGRPLAQLGKEWPEYDSESKKYMELKANEATIGSKLHEDVCSLFRIGFESFRRRRRRGIGLFN